MIIQGTFYVECGYHFMYCLENIRISLNFDDTLRNTLFVLIYSVPSPRNENLNLQVRIKFLNLFLYTCACSSK